MTELTVDKSQYKWESVGVSISSCLAAVNHSCDPNTRQAAALVYPEMVWSVRSTVNAVQRSAK